MKFESYVPQAVRTESHPSITFHDNLVVNDRTIARLLHAALGLTTEIVEFNFAKTVKNRKEESGDLFWYLAVIQDTIPVQSVQDLIRLHSAYNKELSDYQEALYWIGELNDVIKRVIFYKEPINQVNKKGWIPKERVAMCFWGIIRWLEDSQFDISELLVDNLKKLAKRYPDLVWKFEDATDRDVENELSHITEAPSIPDLPEIPLDDYGKVQARWSELLEGVELLNNELAYDSSNTAVYNYLVNEFFDVPQERLLLILGAALTTADIRIWHDGERTFMKVTPNITTLFQETPPPAPPYSFPDFVESINKRNMTHGEVLKFGSNFFSALDDYYSRNDCRVMSLAYKAGYTELMAMRPAETLIALKNIWAVIGVWGALHVFDVPKSDEDISRMLHNQKELCLCPSLLKK